MPITKTQFRGLVNGFQKIFIFFITLQAVKESAKGYQGMVGELKGELKDRHLQKILERTFPQIAQFFCGINFPARQIHCQTFSAPKTRGYLWKNSMERPVWRSSGWANLTYPGPPPKIAVLKGPPHIPNCTLSQNEQASFRKASKKYSSISECFPPALPPSHIV
ncbi:MAG: hypothetical protein HZB23_16330 [Deltaproteobacteria bacterium]|nr:hypothetical protein [Deltaproteobacteria bacterium]